MEAFSSDVTQVYIQSTKPLRRRVYIEAPPEMGLKAGDVLRAVPSLFGITESGLHWYLTYPENHTKKLGMMRATTDPCFLVRREEVTLK